MPASSDPVARPETTHPLRSVVRLTGLSEHVIRAWERRHAAIRPLRSAGGTRRYRESDVRRLRLLRAAVEAGYGIASVATLEDSELEERASVGVNRTPMPGLAEAIDALERLDGAEAERLLGLQLAALGPARFARDYAAPLLRELGERWANDRLCIASEHLGSSILRTLLGASLRSTATSRRARPIVFAAPPGERHDLGLLLGSIMALGAGGNPLFLGAGLPIEVIADAARRTNAIAVVLCVVILPAEQAAARAAELRSTLPPATWLWLAGPRAAGIAPTSGVACLASFDELEQKVELLAEPTSAT